MPSIDSLIPVYNGTANVANGVSVVTSSTIVEPDKRKNHFLLVIHNNSGQAINSIDVVAQNAAFGGYSGTVNLVTAKAVSNGANGKATSVAFAVENADPYLFALGSIKINFNLSAATTQTGSIDYELLAY